MSTTAAATKSTAQVPLRSKVSFAFAEFGSQFVWTTVGTYLMTFYTDVALIAPAAAGTIMLIARVLDGVQDLGFGYIAERTNSRWGRFRPWIIWGSPFLTLTLIVAFWSPNTGDTGKIWFAAITYILLCFVYTIVNMAYGAMAGVMTTDTDERLTLNWIRAIGSGLSQVLLGAITMPLILYFSGAGDGQTINQNGFLWTMIVFGIVALPMFLVTGFNSKEVIIQTPEQAKIPFGTTVKAVLSNLPLMLVFSMLLINLIGLFGRIGMVAYYTANNMGGRHHMGVVMSVFAGFMALGQALLPKLASVVGKVPMLIVSLASNSAILLALFFTDPTNTQMVLVLTAAYGFSLFASPISLSMIPDAVDYYEWKHGIRADGTAYATVSLSTKIASAVGGSAGLYIIGFFGYDGSLDVQAPEVLTGINIATNLVPAILAALAIIPLLFYRLNRKTMKEIEAALKARRAEDEAANA